jgi:hypothetical protein
VDGEGDSATGKGHTDQHAKAVNSEHGLPPKVSFGGRPTGRAGRIRLRKYTDLCIFAQHTPAWTRLVHRLALAD